MMTRLTTALLALALTAPAFAHDDATLDAMASPHGGQVRMAGPYHFELVLGDNEVAVYLTDHGDVPVPSDGVTGNVIIMSGGRATIPVAPAGDNKLAGEGAFHTGPDMKAVVSLTFPDGNTLQARFTPADPSSAQPTATTETTDAVDQAQHR
jgi:hypothetical protein